MLIAIDYDATYTADPDFFDEVIKIGLSHGHSFVCATGRKSVPVGRKPSIPFILCDDEFKFVVAKREGYKIDVWIDDEPGHIEPARKLSWEG